MSSHVSPAPGALPPSRSRSSVISTARQFIHDGTFERHLGPRLTHRTESQLAGNRDAQLAYFAESLTPELRDLGFTVRTVENELSHDHPVLVAQRIEDPELPTLLLYGHADVQFAHPGTWSDGLDPWQLTRRDDRWYGRGAADNKGQHTVNLLALRSVISARTALGYNVTVLIESGEEAGSTGLEATASVQRELLSANLFIGSDGPRYTAETPTVFLGSRGNAAFELRCDLRQEDAHSGNWGGRLRNPATTIAAAIGALVDGNGVVTVPGLLPAAGIPESVRAAIAALPDTAAVADPGWGQPGLTPDERVFAWNTLEVITLQAGDPAEPVNAIPGKASAHLHLRYVVGTDPTQILPAVRARLEEVGLHMVDVVAVSDSPASRLDPATPAVQAAVASISETTGRHVAVLPNLGGTIPNAVFADTLGLPTIWIPHSYPGSQQHAPDEHALVPVIEDGLAIMAGVFWDIAERPEDWFTRV